MKRKISSAFFFSFSFRFPLTEYINDSAYDDNKRTHLRKKKHEKNNCNFEREY